MKIKKNGIICVVTIVVGAALATVLSSSGAGDLFIYGIGIIVGGILGLSIASKP